MGKFDIKQETFIDVRYRPLGMDDPIDDRIKKGDPFRIKEIFVEKTGLLLHLDGYRDERFDAKYFACYENHMPINLNEFVKSALLKSETYNGLIVVHDVVSEWGVFNQPSQVVTTNAESDKRNIFKDVKPGEKFLSRGQHILDYIKTDENGTHYLFTTVKKRNYNDQEYDEEVIVHSDDQGWTWEDPEFTILQKLRTKEDIVALAIEHNPHSSIVPDTIEYGKYSGYNEGFIAAYNFLYKELMYNL